MKPNQMKPNLIKSISTAYQDYTEARQAGNYEAAQEKREETSIFYDLLTHPYSNNKTNPLDLAYLAYFMLEEACYKLTLSDTDEMPLSAEERKLRDRLMDARIITKQSIREHDKESDFWRLFIDLTGAERIAARTK